MTTRLIVSLLACAAIAGCGSSSKSKSTKSDQPAAASSSSSSGTVTVKAANFAFDPKTVTVKKGQEVKWVNEDSAAHNVTSDDGTLKSKDFAQGGSFTYKATKAGTFNYICTIHPQMKATLVVQ